ncbi:MAG: MBL fold metallo-hydrolase [Phycisphaerales bacterium]
MGPPGRRTHGPRDTTLIRSGDRTILVDPGLPPGSSSPGWVNAPAEADDITDVFLTCFRPSHRWGITGFPRGPLADLEAERVGRRRVDRSAQA